MNRTEVSSGKRISRSLASAWERAMSPETAMAKAAPYSTSRAFESASAAAALRPASGAFPMLAHGGSCLKHSRAFFLAALLGEPDGSA